MKPEVISESTFASSTFRCKSVKFREFGFLSRKWRLESILAFAERIFALLQCVAMPLKTCLHHSHHTHASPASLLLKLGRRAVANSAHWVLVRPGSRSGAHGPPGSLQGRVGGGARCNALAWQAADPPGEWRRVDVVWILERLVCTIWNAAERHSVPFPPWRSLRKLRFVFFLWF